MSSLCFKGSAGDGRSRKGQHSTAQHSTSRGAYGFFEMNSQAIRPYVGIIECGERPGSLGMALLAVWGVCTRMLLYPILYKSAMLCNNRSRCSVDGEDEGRVMPTWVALNVRGNVDDGF